MNYCSFRMDRSVAGSWIYPDREGYEVREYQRSIAETCLKKNTLVSLPTGLGKTLIAAVVCDIFYDIMKHL